MFSFLSFCCLFFFGTVQSLDDPGLLPSVAGDASLPVPGFRGADSASVWHPNIRWCYPSRYHSVLVGAAQEDLAVRAPHVRGAETRGSCPLITLSHFNLFQSFLCFPRSPFRAFSCTPFLAEGPGSIFPVSRSSLHPSLAIPPIPLCSKIPKKRGAKQPPLAKSS